MNREHLQLPVIHDFSFFWRGGNVVKVVNDSHPESESYPDLKVSLSNFQTGMGLTGLQY